MFNKICSIVRYEDDPVAEDDALFDLLMKEVQVCVFVVNIYLSVCQSVRLYVLLLAS
jgi:hypothetical protein